MTPKGRRGTAIGAAVVTAAATLYVASNRDRGVRPPGHEEPPRLTIVAIERPEAEKTLRQTICARVNQDAERDVCQEWESGKTYMRLIVPRTEERIWEYRVWDPADPDDPLIAAVDQHVVKVVAGE